MAALFVAGFGPGFGVSLSVLFIVVLIAAIPVFFPFIVVLGVAELLLLLPPDLPEPRGVQGGGGAGGGARP